MDERTWRRARFLINTCYLSVIAALCYLAVKYVASWILPLILAFCIVTVVHPLILRIKEWLNIRQTAASILAIALIYAFIGALLFLILLQLIFLIRGGIALLPEYYKTTIRPALNAISASLRGCFDRLPVRWQPQIEGLRGELFGALQRFLISLSQSIGGLMTSLINGIPAFLIGLIFTVMLSFFVSMRYDAVTAFIKSQLPPGRALPLLRDTRVILFDTIACYLRAILTLAAITFSELSVGLLLLGQRSAIPIAAAIALFDALPFFGAGAALIPWILVELFQRNYPFALGLFILYLIICVVRGLLEARIIGNKLGLNPIVSLVSIYLGFKVFGVPGMIFIPILTRILLDLHKNGQIKMLRPSAADNAVPAPDNTDKL